MVVLLSGCFLATATFAFGPQTTGWLGLAAGAVIATAVLAAFATSGRGVAQRALDCVLALLGGWTIVASRSFAGSELKWLMFASGVAAVLLAVEGLIAHEAVMEVSLRRSAERERAGDTPSLPDRPPAIRVAG
jgi:hypothetical protein